MTRLHRVEGENINLRIEQDMMKQDVADLNKEKSSLKVLNHFIFLTPKEKRISYK